MAAADAPYLQTAAASILSQTLTNWEWIICEDGPTSEATELQGLDPRIKWINTQHRGGPAHARNMAAAEASGDWFRNLDADDYLPEASTLARLMSLTQEVEGTRFLLSRAVDLLPDGSTKTWPVPLPYGPLAPGSLFGYWHERQRHVIHPTTLMVEARTFFAYGGYARLASSEDAALIMRLAQGEQGYLADLDGVIYSKRATSITAQAWHNEATDKARRHRFIARCAQAITSSPSVSSRG